MPSAPAALRALDDGQHRAEFYRMWHAAYGAAFTHPRALEMMGPRPSGDAEALRTRLIAGLARGKTLADLARHPQSGLDAFERALIPLGEESGRFEQSLRLLAEHYTRKHREMLWVKKQLVYPMIVGLAAAFIAPVPLLVAGHPRLYAAIAIGALAALVLSGGGVIAAVAHRFGRRPPLVRARFARALATAIETGLPLGRALVLAAEASADRALLACVAAQGERRLAGQPIAATLRACPHMTPELLAVVETAEATGDFSGLARIAALYEDGFK